MSATAHPGGLDLAGLPGLKEKDLAPCTQCGKPHSLPVFYRVTIAHCVIDTKALSRRCGLAGFIGSEALAQALGPDEDLAKILDQTTGTLCLECAAHTPALALI